MSHIYENDTKPILSAPPYLLQFILSVVLSVLCGATIMFMWNWFVVPLGLPMIGLVQALGLDTLITFIVTTRVNTTPPTHSGIVGSLLSPMRFSHCSPGGCSISSCNPGGCHNGYTNGIDPHR